MKLTPWVSVLCLGLVACSGSKSAQKVSEETPQIELSDAEGLSSDEQESLDTEAAPAESSPELTTEATTDASPEALTESSEATNTDVSTSNNQPLIEESSLENAPVISNVSGTNKEYTVQKNETLMMVAFKLYGDYGRWKEIANQNTEVLKGGAKLREGMKLSYQAPADEFAWNPEGNPYLIRTGDTLGGISKQVYATEKKWKLLWDNNRPLIKNPNKIYAGFTLYYLENGREVANQF
jgi:nucleoid-associated protein YgaU